jgi:hypothetical protein
MRHADATARSSDPMTPPLRNARLVVAVIAASIAILAILPGKVLCVGTDGHHALEIVHAQSVCPALAEDGRTGASDDVRASAHCLDVPASLSPLVSSTPEFDPAHASALVSRIPAGSGRISRPDARDGQRPAFPAPHLASTVLLV